MGRSQLAQILDPAELDAAMGARGRLRVVVLAAWAEERALVEITTPARVTCARCEGGGCDGCGRSGALRTPDEPAARVVQVQLPERLGAGVALRLVRPFGEEAPIEQLMLEIVAGPEPSAGVARLAPPPEPAALPALPRRATAVIFAVIAVLAAVAATLVSR